MSLCSRCGRPCEEHRISIIEMGVKDEQGHVVYKDYCFNYIAELIDFPELRRS